MYTAFLWNMTLCTVVDKYQSFGETCCMMMMMMMNIIIVIGITQEQQQHRGRQMVRSLPEGVLKSSSSSSNISSSFWFSINNILAILLSSKSVFLPKCALLQDFDQNTASTIFAHYTVRSSNHHDFIKIFMLFKHV